MNSPETSVRMLAEWEPHQATLLAWPHNKNTWPDEQLARVEQVYIEIIRTLLSHEPVVLLVRNESMRDRVQKLLPSELIDGKLRFIIIPTNDCWIRDYGPISVELYKNKGHLHGDVHASRGRNSNENDHANRDAHANINNHTSRTSRSAWTLWGYNAWGGKYPPWNLDQQAARTLLDELNRTREGSGLIDCMEYPEILEGGAVECNGAGTLITTESVLLNPNRNPHRNREEIEKMLRHSLGVETIIWLKAGIAGDDTDGHVDDITRFVSENTIVTAVCEDPSDPNFHTLQLNYEILKDARDANGRPFVIETVPMPLYEPKRVAVDGSQQLPASYMNFYIANNILLLPVYGDSRDDEVTKRFRGWFPGREVCPIRCEDLVFGQGGIHCITNTLYC